MAEKLNLHRAKWVFPVSSPPIQDGAVVVSEGTIRRVGPFADLKALCTGVVTDHGEGSLLPALVNAHTHLELSALRGKLSGQRGFVNWIRDLIELRPTITAEKQERGIRDGLRAMHRQGVGLVADVGNTLSAYRLGQEDTSIETVFFQEFLGFTRERAAAVEALLNDLDTRCQLDDSFHLAAHSPYTVSRNLFHSLRLWTELRGKMLAVHVGESPEEEEFLYRGGGPLRDLLDERSAWDPEFTPPGESSIAYLRGLGLLNESTVFIHLVHLNDEDMMMLARSEVKCVVCPRSNLFLQVGFPDVEKMIGYGLCPALGTDSLASNGSLSILEEMGAVREQAPGVPPGEILGMATLNGARALNRCDRYGSLVAGKEARMFFVPGDAESGNEVLERIMGNAATVSVYWVG